MNFKGKIPWGFILAHGGLTATTTASQRSARAALGEFAIELLEKLGVSEAQLAKLVDEADPIACLQNVRSGDVSEPITEVTTEVAPEAVAPEVVT
jgi:hypothetical protein